MWQIFDKLTGLGGSLILAGAGLRFLAKTNWKKVGIVLAAMGLFWLGGEMIKLGVAAPRPCWNPATPSLVSCPESFSFPSGHVLAAAMAAAVVGLAVKVRGVRAMGVVWVVFVAMTRLLTGIHTWFDVFGGMVLGTVFGWMTWRGYFK